MLAGGFIAVALVFAVLTAGLLIGEIVLMLNDSKDMMYKKGERINTISIFLWKLSRKNECLIFFD